MKRDQHLSKFILTVSLIALFVLFEIAMYITLSFGWPLPRNIKLFAMLPGFNDISILDTISDYPVQRYSPISWPVEEIVQNMLRDFDNICKPVHIFVIPNFDYLNVNNLTLELTRTNSRNITLFGGIDKQSFTTEPELTRFVDSLEYVFFVDGEFGPDFQWDRVFFSQIQREVRRKWDKGDFMVMRSYDLPNGKTIHLLRTKRSEPSICQSSRPSIPVCLPGACGG